jgi:hypothetical protein
MMMWGVSRGLELSPSSSAGDLIDLKQAVQKVEASTPPLTPASLDLLRRRCFQPAMIQRNKPMINALEKLNDRLNLEQARVAKKEIESDRHDANNKEFIRLLDRVVSMAIDDGQTDSMLKQLSGRID